MTEVNALSPQFVNEAFSIALVFVLLCVVAENVVKDRQTHT